jgi:polyribonucleotide nucleotidyltransferase
MAVAERAAHHHMIIPKDKIRDVIGTGGKVIREICESTGAKIDIEDDGTVKVPPPIWVRNGSRLTSS